MPGAAVACNGTGAAKASNKRMDDGSLIRYGGLLSSAKVTFFVDTALFISGFWRIMFMK